LCTLRLAGIGAGLDVILSLFALDLSNRRVAQANTSTKASGMPALKPKTIHKKELAKG
jgi:hypothetical protein